MPLTFGDCTLDPARRELFRAGVVIATTPKVFDALLYLLNHREHVVSRDDLLNAVWSGRIVSESTLASHINAVRSAIGDSGKAQHLIRTVARKGFRFVGAVSETEMVQSFAQTSIRSDTTNNGAADSAMLLPMLPAKPSIAVLPFVNLSGDRQQDYFADGVVEDIIAALSRLRWLFVIARNSSFTYKGRVLNVMQVGRELGVRYVLEGSVRRADDRLRLTGQIIDTTTGAHVWADRFEGSLADIFALQDKLTESVVGAIAIEIERAEIRRAMLKPTESLDAYDYYLRGMAAFHQGAREAIDAALPLFHKAIELDADFAAAYGMAAWCHCWRKINRWASGPDENTEAARLARRAVALGKHDAVALTRGAHALAHFGGDMDHCNALIDRALTLDPNLAAAWLFSGYLRIWHSEPDAAIERFEHAMRLNPLDPEMFRMQAGMALAHLLAGRFDAASSWAQKAHRDMPTFVMAIAIIAASLALAGKTDKARSAMRILRQLDPTLRLSTLQDWLPFHRQEDFIRFADGLQRAGLPG